MFLFMSAVSCVRAVNMITSFLADILIAFPLLMPHIKWSQVDGQTDNTQNSLAFNVSLYLTDILPFGYFCSSDCVIYYSQNTEKHFATR